MKDNRATMLSHMYHARVTKVYMLPSDVTDLLASTTGSSSHFAGKLSA